MDQGRRGAASQRRLVRLIAGGTAIGGAGWAAGSAVVGSGLSVLAQSGLLLLLGCALLVAVMVLPVLIGQTLKAWRTDRLLESVADHDDEAPWLAEIYRHLDRAA